MPMVWNAEAEAKLISAIFSVCDIKITQNELKAIAGIMGDDCTPKALTHRIAKFRAAKANFNGGGNKSKNDDSGIDVPSPISASASKGKKRSIPKGKKVSASQVVADPEEESDEDGEIVLSKPKPTTKKRTSSGKMKNDSGEVLLDDREIAFGEDVGQGFRKKRDVKIEATEDDEDDDALL